MMTIIYSSVGIITMHTHTKKIIRLKHCHDFPNTSQLIYPGDKLKIAAQRMCHDTHTLTITYTTTHNNMQI